MKVIVLAENTASSSAISAEHGLSLYIETEGRKVLFDMGQTDLFYQNAKKLGVDLSQVDFAVLSHGHYDHGGGLKTFFEVNDHAPVYAHKDVFLPHYNGTEKYIGLDVALKTHPRIALLDQPFRVGNCSILSCNEKAQNVPPSCLTEKVGDGFIPDDFRHEQFLLVQEKGKTVLFSGCSHKGVLNVVKWFSPDVFIGGLHFSKLPLDANLAAAAKKLATYPTAFYSCHCTGREQVAFLQRWMPSLYGVSCGQTIIV